MAVMRDRNKSVAESLPSFKQHDVVHVIMKGSDGKFILFARGHEDEHRYAPGKLNGMTEHIERGEMPLQAAIRGLKEEYGLHLEEASLVYIGKKQTTDQQYKFFISAEVFQVTLAPEIEATMVEKSPEVVKGSKIRIAPDHIMDSYHMLTSVDRMAFELERDLRVAVRH